MTADQNASGRILLVEDNIDTRDAIALLLRTKGYEVIKAANGREALARLREGPRPDLILLDLYMPRMTGWELAERLRDDPELASIPVVVLSGVHSMRDRVVPALGVADCVPKLADLETLLTTIRRYCRPGGRGMSVRTA